jgi:solute carrier family 25, member 38
LQPLDLLKTRMQQYGSSNLAQAIRDVQGTSGVFTGLWRGTVPSALRTGLGSAVYFTTLNAMRQEAAKSTLFGRSGTPTSGSSALPSLSNSANLVSGAAARTFAGFVLMPLTVIKVRFESNYYKYASVWAAAKGIQRADGFRGFFAGFGATALRDAPYAGTYVLTYELLKPRLGRLLSSPSRNGSGPTTPMGASVSGSVNFASATLAAGICSALSNPFDAVKTRIQLQPQKYKNLIHAASKMFAEEGFRSFFDGLALRMSRKALSSALAWTLYEELIRRSGML